MLSPSFRGYFTKNLKISQILEKGKKTESKFIKICQKKKNVISPEFYS